MNNKISVIMGIYNCASTLVEAVRSIQNQTYTNWELIMCDDGSLDETYSVAEQLAREDKRIILIKNEQNCGLNITLNKCLKYATGEYIARMDADDLCDPLRFEKQVAFLEQNHEFSIVSTAMIYFDETGEWGKTKVIQYPEVVDIVLRSPICHAPVMMQKACMDCVNGYSLDKRTLRVEDVDLWIRLYAVGYRCYNINEPLYKMRNDKNAYARRKYRYRINSAYVRIKGCRQFNLGFWCYVKACFPLLIGLIPTSLRRKMKGLLHR